MIKGNKNLLEAWTKYAANYKVYIATRKLLFDYAVKFDIESKKNKAAIELMIAEQRNKIQSLRVRREKALNKQAEDFVNDPTLHYYATLDLQRIDSLYRKAKEELALLNEQHAQASYSLFIDVLTLRYEALATRMRNDWTDALQAEGFDALFPDWLYENGLIVSCTVTNKFTNTKLTFRMPDND